MYSQCSLRVWRLLDPVGVNVGSLWRNARPTKQHRGGVRVRAANLAQCSPRRRRRCDGLAIYLQKDQCVIRAIFVHPGHPIAPRYRLALDLAAPDVDVLNTSLRRRETSLLRFAHGAPFEFVSAMLTKSLQPCQGELS